MSEVERGIAAYHAGDFKQAQRILSAALEDNKADDTAWLYLGHSLTDPDQRKQCFQMALRVNPDNVEAKHALASTISTINKISTGKLPAVVDPDPEPLPLFQPSRTVPEVHRSPKHNRLLTAIPGAPEEMTLQGVTASLSKYALFLPGIVRGNSLPTTVTWWDYWSIVVVVTLLNGLLVVVRNTLISIRLETALFFPQFLTLPLLTLLSGCTAVFAGCFISHWYITRQAYGRGSLLEHSYLLAALWGPASVMTGLFDVLSVFAGGDMLKTEHLVLHGFPNMTPFVMALTLLAAVVTGFTLYLMGRQLGKVHSINSLVLWVTSGIMLTITALLF